MPGINRLQTTVMQLNGDVTSKTKMAESLQTKAQAHLDAGDEVKAQVEQESAEKYFQEARDIEASIQSMQAVMTTKMLQKDKVDRDIDELTRKYEKDLAKLKSEADSLS